MADAPGPYAPPPYSPMPHSTVPRRIYPALGGGSTLLLMATLVIAALTAAQAFWTSRQVDALRADVGALRVALDRIEAGVGASRRDLDGLKAEAAAIRAAQSEMEREVREALVRPAEPERPTTASDPAAPLVPGPPLPDLPLAGSPLASPLVSGTGDSGPGAEPPTPGNPGTAATRTSLMAEPVYFENGDEVGWISQLNFPDRVWILVTGGGKSGFWSTAPATLVSSQKGLVLSKEAEQALRGEAELSALIPQPFASGETPVACRPLTLGETLADACKEI